MPARVTGSALTVCHFYHRDFERCKIMDMHLRDMAAQLLPVRFVKLNAEKATFFVGKLGVKVPPPRRGERFWLLGRRRDKALEVQFETKKDPVPG